MNEAAQAARPRLKLPEAQNGTGAAIDERQRAALAQKFRVKNSDKIEGMVAAIAGAVPPERPHREGIETAESTQRDRPETAKSSPPAKATAEPQKRPWTPFNPRIMVREFEMTDGRLITLHRADIRFATPLKSDPETATLAGIKTGANPMPLKLAYADFIQWWLEGRELGRK